MISDLEAAGPAALRELTTADAVERLNPVPAEEAANTLATLPFAQAVAILDQPELTDAPAILAAMPEALAGRLLEAMADDRAADIDQIGHRRIAPHRAVSAEHIGKKGANGGKGERLRDDIIQRRHVAARIQIKGARDRHTSQAEVEPQFDDFALKFFTHACGAISFEIREILGLLDVYVIQNRHYTR